MDVRVEKILPQHWHGLAELSHSICFGELRPESMNRHHFVVGVFVDKEIAGYFTCLEMDAETVYIQHGGAFPNYEKTVVVLKGYQQMLAELAVNYERVWTRVENTNSAMLKLALHVGFLITGIYQFKGKTLVELQLDFNKED